MKIIEAIWFTEMKQHVIGIVIGTDEATGKPIAYIGTAPGRDEEEDMKHIAEMGASLTSTTARELWEKLK